jgi:hypothetical protein
MHRSLSPVHYVLLKFERYYEYKFCQVAGSDPDPDRLQTESRIQDALFMLSFLKL